MIICAGLTILHHGFWDSKKGLGPKCFPHHRCYCEQYKNNDHKTPLWHQLLLRCKSLLFANVSDSLLTHRVTAARKRFAAVSCFLWKKHMFHFMLHALARPQIIQKTYRKYTPREDKQRWTNSEIEYWNYNNQQLCQECQDIHIWSFEGCSSEEWVNREKVNQKEEETSIKPTWRQFMVCRWGASYGVPKKH